MIQEFIAQLETLKNNNPEKLHRVKNYPMLKESLNQLDQLIGMRNFKRNIIDVVKNFITAKDVSNNRNHSVIDGPPGCGKTTLAEIIARIYVSLGLLNTRTKPLTTGDWTTKTINEINPALLTAAISILIVVVFKFSWILVGFLVFIVFLMFVTSSRTVTVKNDNSSTARSDDYFIKLTRENLVSQYVGGTAHQARKTLASCIGKVVFIDEAYSLVNSKTIDPYGEEALNVLITWMDENRGNCLVIFGGYEEKLKNSIFRVQPGLKRRCTYIYHVDKYSSDELLDIFQLQLRKHKLQLSTQKGEYQIIKGYFNKYRDLFPYSGGDTERLSMYTEQVYNRKLFDHIVSNKEHHGMVDSEIILEAFNMLSAAQQEIQSNDKYSDNGLKKLMDSLMGD